MTSAWRRAACTLAVVVVACGPAVEGRAPPTTALVPVGSPFFDAGVVTEGTELAVKFRMRNDSPRTVTITRVSPSCTCSSAAVDRASLAPGEEAQLEVVVDTTGRPGRLGANVAVVSDAAEPLAFRIEGLVGRPRALEISPTRVDFGELSHGARATREVRIAVKSRWGMPLPEALELAPDQDLEGFVELDYEPGDSLVPDGDFIARVGKLRIDLRGEFEGRLSGFVRVASEGDEWPLGGGITVTGTVSGPFSLSESSVFFDGVEAGSRCVETVEVRWRDPEKPGRIEVTSQEAWLSAEVLRDQSAVRVLALAPEAGFHAGTLVVSSDSSKLRVPVKLFSR